METLNREFQINECRAARNAWMRQARNASADVLPLRRAECVRKARFHHRNMMAARRAEWY